VDDRLAQQLVAEVVGEVAVVGGVDMVGENGGRETRSVCGLSGLARFALAKARRRNVRKRSNANRMRRAHGSLAARHAHPA